MAAIFISHSSQDKAAAVQLMHWLESQGFTALFLDSDAQHGIKPGSGWEKTLYREIQRANAVLLLLSTQWEASKWCWSEYTQARALGKGIFPLRIEAGVQTTTASELQHIDLTANREDGLQRLLAELTELTLSLQQRFAWDKTRPPYPGMLAFEAEDAPVFFGRDADTHRLWEQLNQRRTQGGDSLLVMLAASGAGKSSLLKAGLLPRLRRDARHWLVLEALRPEQEPLRKLAQVLATALGTPAGAEALYQQLQGEQAVTALQECLQQLRARSAQWEATVLLSIDQAEELFSTAKPAETTQLLRLLGAAQIGQLPLLTLLAMRSDYLEKLQAVADKPPFRPFTLDPLPLERVSELIRGPAQVVGVTVDDGLISAATRDAATVDALPLLAFALRELYERFGADGDLTLDEYHRLGSEHLNPLENAVQHKAGEAIQPERLSAAALQALRDAFIPHMVRVNEAGDYVRQPADWAALPTAAYPLLDQLTRARLLVQRSDGGVKLVEVAHEALLRHWRLLNGWLREEHDFLLGKQQLEYNLRDWQHLPEAQRGKGLLQGIALERAREWLLADRAGLSAAERDFIRQSHQAEERRRTGQRNRLLGFIAVLGVVAAVAVWQAISATRAEQRVAREQQQTAQALSEANTLIDFINFGLRDKLQPIGRLDIMQDIQSRVTAYYNNLGGTVQDDGMQRQRATNLLQQADTLAAQGKLPEAEKLYREANQSFQQRADSDPSNTGWQRDLSVSFDRIGDILSRQGKLDEAQAAFGKGLAIRKKLADSDPSNTDWQRDLSVSLNKIGDILSRQGKLDEAQAVFGKDLVIAQKLADSDPSNAGWQRDLSVSLNKIGDILRVQGKLEEAQAEFGKGLAILQKLADSDPSNAGWQADVVISHQRLMTIALEQGDTGQAKKHIMAALAVLEPLERAGLLNASQQGWPDDMRRRLNELK